MRGRLDYEAYRALVGGAHLRPLGGLQTALAAAAGAAPPRRRRFRPDGSIAATAQQASIAACNCAGPLGQRGGGDAVLQSGAAWARAWRAAPDAAARLDLLRRGAAVGALPRLLRLELNARLLEELVACLAAHVQAAGGAGEAATLAGAALRAAAGAAAGGVARAALSSQGRQQLAALEGALAGGDATV